MYNDYFIFRAEPERDPLAFSAEDKVSEPVKQAVKI